MTVLVDIADRLYDYTDEEKAAQAVEEFQLVTGADDATVVSIWEDKADPRRAQLEKLIFEAVDRNGPARRAREHVPGGITLSLE